MLTTRSGKGMKAQVMGTTPVEWIAIIVAVLSPAVGVVVFAYEKFETKEHAAEYKSDMRDTIHRIEEKVDILIDSKRR